MAAKKKIFIDTETTGFSPDKGDEILQFSAVDEKGRKLFDKRFKPEKKKSWGAAQRVHGISPSSVEDCENFKKSRKKIQSLIDGADEIHAYNARLDSDFLKSQGIKIDADKVVDDLPRAKKFFSGKTKDAKLETVARHIGHTGKSHDALEDARALAAVSKYMDEAESPRTGTRRASKAKPCLVLGLLILLMALAIFVMNKWFYGVAACVSATSALICIIAILAFAMIATLGNGACSSRGKARVLRLIVDIVIIVFDVLMMLGTVMVEEGAGFKYGFSAFLGVLLLILLIRARKNVGF